MNLTDNDKIITFDTLFTNNTLQLCKIFLAYLSPPLQKHLAIYIKFMELQYTLTFFRQNPRTVLSCAGNQETSWACICDEMLPFCTPAQKEQMQNAKQMMTQWESMQQMMEMVQMMQSMFPEGFNPADSDMDPTQILNLFGGGDISAFGNMDLSAFFAQEPEQPTENKEE